MSPIILTLILSSCLLSTLAQNPQNQVTCLLMKASDSFCMTCDTATESICQSCPSNYYMHDTTGLCSRIRTGDTSPSNMVNNVRTYTYTTNNQTTQVVQTLDPYCVLPANINSNSSASCASCTAYPDISISTTTTTGQQAAGGTGGSTTTTTTVDNPRYLGDDNLTCHSHCDYATYGMFANSSTYQCSTCASTCIKCSSSSNCNECLFSKQRFQGAATIDTFLNIAYNGMLTCTAAKTDSTKTLTYYVGPAGSTSRCGSGACSNSGSGSGTLWDDLTMVFKDIITQAASYTSINVKIYLLKSGTNLIHYVLDQDTQTGFYGYNYYTPTTNGHLPRPFERTLATVYIGPIYCSDQPTQQGCLAAGEKPTIKWKSSMTHLSVTNSFTIENVIIDGSDMTPLNIKNAALYTCFTQRSQCCTYNSATDTVTQASTPSSCEPSSPDYTDWSVNSTVYEAKYKTGQLYGVFNFEFIRDKTNAPVPTLTISNCEVRNFFFSKYHTSFIQMSSLGGNLIIKNSVFDRFFFPHGLISNSHKQLDRNLFGFSSFNDETCRSVQGLSSSVNCHNVTIVGSNFTNYNPYKVTNLNSNDVHSVEGAVLAVHNLDGPITIYNCIFQSMLAFNRLSTTGSGQYDCLAFNPNSWGADAGATNQTIHNIGTGSNYKIWLDKHFRKYAENKMANTSITAVVHIRNVTKGLTIYDNTFDQIYTVVGGAIYIEGFNNTLAAPIIISTNTFTNNFAQFIGANLFIYKYGYNIPRLDCSGILVDLNTFTDNYGCMNTIGNVILACEPNDYNAYSYPSTVGSTSFSSYYETYSKTSNQGFEVDDYSYRNFTRYLNEFSENKSIANTYTHSIYTSLTFDSKQVVFSNNVLERNYMKLSNGLYIQGPLYLVVEGNTFEDNSIPTASIYSNTAFSSNAFQLTSLTTPSMTTDSYMVESVPLVIRQANYVKIKNNIFDGNSQGFLGGDYYLAQAITLFQLIGKDGVVIEGNTFQNHTGLTISNSTAGYYKYSSSPIIAFNFWELTSEFVKGVDEDGDGVIDYPDANTFTVEDCVFRNNVFNFDSGADTKGIYYSNGAMKQTYSTAFAHLLKYFNGEEALGSITSTFTSPVSWSTGPPMISLHVTVSGSNITNNTINNGFCVFNSFWFNQFNIENLIFEDNTITGDSTNLGGYICASKDQLFSQFNNGSTLVYSDISWTGDTGTLFYLTSITKGDPQSTKDYIINIDTITISGTTSSSLAPFAASSASNVSITTVTVSSSYGYYGVFYLSSVSNFYANTITVTDSTGYDTGLIYANSAATTVFYNLVCSNNALTTLTSTTTFDWTQLAITQNISSVQALVKQNSGNLTLVSSQFSGSDIPLGFLSSDGYLNLYTVTISDMDVDYSLFLAIGSTTLYFSASYVYDITADQTTASAGVIIADSSKVTAVSSYFYTITAPTSGFLLCKLSTITLTNSNISYVNVTGENGVLSAQLGKVIVSGTYFGYNYAYDQNIFSVTLGAVTIDSSTFEKNYAASMSSGLFVKKSTGTTKISSTTFIGRNTLETDGILAEFMVIYDSSVNLDGVTFYNAYASAGAMYVDAESYTITINDLTATDNYADEYGVVTVWGTLVVTSSEFTGNQYSIYTEATNIDIEDTVFTEEIIRSVVISCTDTTGASIIFDNVTFNGYPDQSTWEVTADYSDVNDSAAIQLTACSGVVIQNSVFKNLIDTNTAKCGAGVYVYSESSTSAIYTVQISNTDFYNTIATDGGAICIQNYGNGMSQIDVTDVTINYGRAVSLGAAIYYDNFETSEKTVTYTASDGIDYLSLSSNVVIENSEAGVGGGGIYYTQLRPTSAGVTFTDNSASYGPNWASYPVAITVITDPDSSIYSSSTRILKENNSESRSLMTATSTVQNFVSGQQLDPPVVLGLLDIDGQIVGNWDSSTVSLTYTDSNLKASTTTEFTASSGYFVLDPLILSYVPGDYVDITLTTTIETLSSDILGLDESISLTITPFFRLCTVGERLTDANECQLCDADKALFESNSKDQCIDCPDNMDCYGGSQIGPQKDYSRFSNWNSLAVACLNDEACLGDSVSTELSETLYCKEVYSGDSTFCHTGWCSARYTGNLCATCTSGNAKSSDIYCVPCTDNPMYYFVAVLVIIGAIAFIVFTVRNALVVKDFAKSGGKPKTSILIKIFLNYVQLVSIVSSFDFQWPSQVQSLFAVNSKVSSSSSSVFSVDCFLPSSSDGNMRPFFIKLLFISLSPIFMIGLAALVWVVILKVKKAWDSIVFKSNLTTTCVILLFMIHTTLVQTAIYGFRCQNIGDESGTYQEYYLAKDLEIKCWEGVHLLWVFAVSLPAFVLWGIGIPLFAFRILKKNQEIFEHADFKTKYGFLYDGYKKEKYFWEFVILYRKVIMIFISVFMVTYGVQIQALAVLGVSFLSYVLHMRGKPFQEDDLNIMEKKALINATITLYCGVYYITNELPTAVSYVLLVVIIGINGYFFLFWFLTLLREYKKMLMKKPGDQGKSNFLRKFLDKLDKWVIKDKEKDKKKSIVDKSDHLEVQAFVGEPMQQVSNLEMSPPGPAAMGVRPDKEDMMMGVEPDKDDIQEIILKKMNSDA